MKKISAAAQLLCSSFIIVGAQRQQQQNIKIVHLGDSFSSGNGFDIDNNNHWYGPKWCFRNSDGWGEQAANIVQKAIDIDHDNVHIDYSNHACHGAKIQHITNIYTQTESCAQDDEDPQYTQTYPPIWSLSRDCEHIMAPQLSNVDRYVDVVLLTIGGNDASFTPIVSSCFLPSTYGLITDDCEDVVSYSKRYLEGSMTGEECDELQVTSGQDSDCAFETDMIHLLDAITKRMKDGSKVFLHAYPYLATDKENIENQLVRELNTIGIEKQTEAIEYINSKLQESGKDVEVILFTDGVKVFAGHEAETERGTTNPYGWLNELTAGGITFSTSQFDIPQLIQFGLEMSMPDTENFIPDFEVEGPTNVLNDEEKSQLYHPNAAGHAAWAASFAVILEDAVREMILEIGTKPTYSPSYSPTKSPSLSPSDTVRSFSPVFITIRNLTFNKY